MMTIEQLRMRVRKARYDSLRPRHRFPPTSDSYKLIIDDDDVFRQAFENILRFNHHTARVLTNDDSIVVSEAAYVTISEEDYRHFYVIKDEVFRISVDFMPRDTHLCTTLEIVGDVASAEQALTLILMADGETERFDWHAQCPACSLRLCDECRAEGELAQDVQVC